jgi:hypothetical protein
MEKISVVVVAPSDRVELVESKKDYIASETRAVELRVTTNRDEAYQHGGLVEEWDIDEDLYIISVKPLNQQ